MSKKEQTSKYSLGMRIFALALTGILCFGTFAYLLFLFI